MPAVGRTDSFWEGSGQEVTAARAPLLPCSQAHLLTVSPLFWTVFLPTKPRDSRLVEQDR